jgi:hypothetical protein
VGLGVDPLEGGGIGCPGTAGEAAEEGVRDEGGVHVPVEVGRHGADQAARPHQGAQLLESKHMQLNNINYFDGSLLKLFKKETHFFSWKKLPAWLYLNEREAFYKYNFLIMKEISHACYRFFSGGW